MNHLLLRRALVVRAKRAIVVKEAVAIPDWCYDTIIRVVLANLETFAPVEPQTVRHTTCRHCAQDIEGMRPFRRGEWRDRGNNTHCPDDSGRVHAPVKA